MIYGYARISRPQQSIQRQIRNIEKIYPKALILQEAYTGTKMERPEWMKLYKRVKAGDTIVFDSVSRMSRTADEGFSVYKELFDRNVNLVFLKEPHINTDTYKRALQNKVKLTGDKVDLILKGVNEYLMALAEEQIKIAFDQSEKEVMDLRQRTREGIETARLNGKQIGHKPGVPRVAKKEAPSKAMILKLSKSFNGNLSDVECMKLVNLSRNTYYKYKKELSLNE